MSKTKSTKPSRTPSSSANRASGSKSSSKSGGSKSGYNMPKSPTGSRSSKSGGASRVKSSISSSGGKPQKTSFKAGSSKRTGAGKGKYKVDKGQNSGIMNRMRSTFSRSSGGYNSGRTTRPSILRTGLIILAVIVVILLILLFSTVFKPKAVDETTTSEYGLQTTATVSTSDAEQATTVPVNASADAGDMPVEPAQRNGMYDAPPAMQIDPNKIYNATFATEKGEIVIELFADKAPNTVNNFVALARDGFYDNTTFHRVLADFMAQGGDPTGSGMGGPGYTFEDEFDPSLRHDSAGTLSMANSGANTNGSQFFITFAPTPWLDGLHTVFGKVVKGMDVLQSISLRDPQTATEAGDSILSIRIAESDVSLLPTPTPLVYVQPGEIPMPEDPAARNGLYAGKAPAMVIDPAKSYTAVIQTEKGDITAELYADLVPETVNNFVFLAREGYYDNTFFHRVIEGFMAQAGDPTGLGSGGPGYAFADEINVTLRHEGAGILSMANAGANTNGSQFFITFDSTPWLDGMHTVFGKVIEGFEVLDSLSIRDPQTASTPGDMIETITIIEE